MAFSVLLLFISVCVSTGESSPTNPHRVQFHLPDNTPANHLVGNILGGVSLAQPLVRAMLNPDTWFRVTNTGDLFTRDSLDRDTICSRLACCLADFCQIQLEAYLFDSRPTPTTVRVTLFVADENDNPPTFPQLSQKDKEAKWWQVSIPESAAVGTKHTLPAATDADSSRFGVHHYKLFSAANSRSPMRPDDRLPFSLVTPPTTYPMPVVAPAPQLQIDRPLDRETKPSYDMYLVVEDAGSPPLTTTLSVRVNLLDTNDNAPSFVNQTDLAISIPESTSIGSVVHQFFVKDPDEGPNGNVTLSIDWPASYPGVNQTVLNRLSSKYMIHPYTGELRVVQPLDYEDELERKVVLVVRAADSGSPQQTASSSLTITLTDVNDNGPVIEILGVDVRNDPISDGGTGVSTFKENDPEPQLLRLISVSDPDTVSIGKLSCKLSDQHQGENDFVLTSYSDTMYGLLNARAFDYEREASRTGHLSVSVECTDSAEPKRTRQQWIQIPLVDVNDNWPQFSQANYEFRIAENTEPGTEIGVVQATDADSGFHGQVTYRLTADNAAWLNLVRIDPKTGTVYVNAMLDRETVDHLEFHVTASDGNPNAADSEKAMQKTNTTGLTILVTDVNDNAPTCVGSKEIHVSENTAIGTRVLKKIAVSDPDLGPNGSVLVSLIELPYMYSINLINHGLHSASTVPEKRQYLPFVIKDDLSLVTSGALDREQQTQVILTLLVKDQGQPIPLSATCSLTVVIDDVNDNPPQLIYPRNNSFLFGQREHSEPHTPYARATIPANIPYGSRIITIRGKDPDAGSNGTVTYHLLAQTDPIRRDIMMDFTELGSNDPFLEEGVLVYRDGMHLFELDSQTGFMTTAWGQSQDNSASEPVEEIAPSNGSSEIVKRRRRVEQPEPGLYAILVELRDMGPTPMTTKAIFYVNISEPVGMGFAFGLFSETNLSNTVILVLIMVCSLALIISLTAAIFWVRFRNDSSIISRPGSRNYGGSYNGPTVITHDSMPNGYFYPASYPPLGSPTDLSEMDHRFIDSTLMHGKDGTLQTNWTELNLDTGQSPDYQAGMYGGSLVPSSLDGTATTFQLCSMSKPEEAAATVYPSGIHLVPVSGCGGGAGAGSGIGSDRTELTVYQTTRTLSGTPNWLPCTDSYVTDPTMIIRMDGGYGPVECMGLGQATNNSTGGSDSGVDSGAGVALGTITSSSPVMDGRGRTNHISNPIGKSGFVDHLHSSTVPRTFFTRNSPTSLSPTDGIDASTHTGDAVAHGPREPYFRVGSNTPHTMQMVHHPNSTLGHTLRRENDTDLQTVSVGTTKRLKNSSHSGILVSTTLYSNGLK
ncbi:unnamed protein product [Echinostoma caproni]|uniref:Protocadherin-11 Y-linked n=1 Tax=Echinostoma caproni TaxID=27848 RepID=A0A183A4X0_9TREM|nr:unnamed protein product [Echinostoma caproni]